MELVFDVVSAQQFAPGLLTSKSFKKAGGVIGRGEDCDWAIPDSKRILSGRHAQVSYVDGHFYLTDTSSNAIRFVRVGASITRPIIATVRNQIPPRKTDRTRPWRSARFISGSISRKAPPTTGR